MVDVRLASPSAAVSASYEAAAAVLRGDLTCWLPPALPGETAGSWRTRVRAGLVPVALECRASIPFSRAAETSRFLRVRAVPAALGGGLSGRVVPAFSGDLILRPTGEDSSELTLRLRRDERRGRTKIRRQVAQGLVAGIAERLAEAPVPAPDTDGGTARTVVHCPVIRP